MASGEREGGRIGGSDSINPSLSPSLSLCLPPSPSRFFCLASLLHAPFISLSPLPQDFVPLAWFVGRVRRHLRDTGSSLTVSSVVSFVPAVEEPADACCRCCKLIAQTTSAAGCNKHSTQFLKRIQQFIAAGWRPRPPRHLAGVRLESGVAHRADGCLAAPPLLPCRIVDSSPDPHFA